MPDYNQNIARNLRQIAVALLNYEDRDGCFPPLAIPLLSWRVAILWVDHNALFKQFHLDEPWDSEHNKSHRTKPILIWLLRRGQDAVLLCF
jgi:hypothetical protein